MTEEKQAFEITDLNSLAWVFREILTPKKAEIAANVAFAKAEIERVQKWLEDANKGMEQDVEYWTHRVSDYHAQELANGSKHKTLSTPYGKCKSITSKAQPEVADKDKLLEYAKTNGYTEYIKTEESIKWGDMKKTLQVSGVNVVDENGLIVDGMKVKPETTTFKIEVE